MTRRRLSPEERRGELLAAAEELLLDGEELSLDRVAERAACSRNLAYNYFSNLDALRESLRERQVARLANAVVERIPRPAPVREWMAAWVSLVLDEAAARGPLLLALYEQRAVGPQGRAVALGTVAGIESKLVGDGLVEAPRARVLARVLSGVLFSGAVALVVDGCERSSVEAEVWKAVDALLP